MTPKSELKALTPAQIVKLHICPGCGGDVTRRDPRGPVPSYCSTECRKAANAQALIDGSAIIKLAKAWREARGSGPTGAAAFRQMTAALDLLLEADRSKGKPSALYAAAVMLNSGTSYQDRKGCS